MEYDESEHTMKRTILTTAILAATTVGAGWEGDDGGLTPAEASSSAVRLEQMQLTEPPAPPAILGPLGKPIAPFWLDGCEEFRWYADQFGLPKFFDGIAWRESNCRNEDSVRTSCCHGYLQLNANLHVRDHRLAGPYAACGVFGNEDINSDNPADKQRHLCAATALYNEMGTQPWG